MSFSTKFKVGDYIRGKNSREVFKIIEVNLDENGYYYSAKSVINKYISYVDEERALPITDVEVMAIKLGCKDLDETQTNLLVKAP